MSNEARIQELSYQVTDLLNRANSIQSEIYELETSAWNEGSSGQELMWAKQEAENLVNNLQNILTAAQLAGQDTYFQETALANAKANLSEINRKIQSQTIRNQQRREKLEILRSKLANINTAIQSKKAEISSLGGTYW